MARENSAWGYTRILGELKKLGVRTSRTNVVNILRSIAVDPKIDPTKGTWADFLRAHGSTLWQCDFFSKNVITPEGVMRQCIVMVFIHMLSRRVFVSSSTFKTTGAWMTQQVSAFLEHTKAIGMPAGLVFCDRDKKFQAKEFEGVLQLAGVKVHRLAYRAPNTNAYVERFVQSIQQECLDKFLVYDPVHMDHLIREYVEYYHTERPHQGKGNVPLTAGPPATAGDATGEVRCRERLGGVLRHYYRAAA